MTWTALGFVALGGAIGSVARALVGAAVPAGSLPWATITVNVAGSLAIGWLMGRLVGGDAWVHAHSFWVVGICGGFTTFSAFSWQTFEQLQRGQWLLAAANVIVSFVVCLAATGLGWRLAR
ncbi:MAG: CrcB family protein [Verrucomicrobiota bacterium]